MATAGIDFAGVDAASETVDTSTQDSQVDSGQVDTPVPEAGQQSEQQTQQPIETQTSDGRRGPANVRNSLKAASEALPDQAGTFKELGNAYFREQAYKQHFATPQEAASAKQLITDIGGIEGIAGMQQRVQSIEAQDSGLRDGNPEVLDAMFKDFPEGAAALAPHYLDKLAQTNPEAFQSAIAPHAVAMLDAAAGAFIANLANEQDVNKLSQGVKQLKQWLDGQKGNVGEMKNTRQSAANDPAQKRLKEQQDQLKSEREQLFNGQVSERVNAAANQDIAKAADPYVKQYKLGDEQKAFFTEQLSAKLVAELNSDANYKKQIDIRKAAKDRNPQAIADFMVSQVRERLPKAALSLAKQMYGGGVRPNPQNTQQSGDQQPTVSNGRLFVSQRPDNSQLRTDYDGYQLDWIKGYGVRRDGQKIQWRK